MILGLDLATTRTQIAVGRVSHRFDERDGQAERLMGDIALIMKQACASYADLTGVIVLTGPGSFTGLRVALATGHGVAKARGIPILGIRIDEAFSALVPADGDQMLLLDTRRDDLAVARRAQGEAAFGDLTEMTPDAIKDELDIHPALILGNGCGLYTEKTDNMPVMGPGWIDMASVIEAFKSRIAALQPGYKTENTDVFYLRAPDVTISSKKFEHQTLYTQ